MIISKTPFQTHSAHRASSTYPVCIVSRSLGPEPEPAEKKKSPCQAEIGSWNEMKMYIILPLEHQSITHDYQKSNEINTHDFDMLRKYIGWLL